MHPQILFVPSNTIKALADRFLDGFETRLREQRVHVVGWIPRRYRAHRHLLVVRGAPRTAPTGEGPVPGLLVTDNADPELALWLTPITPRERRRLLAALTKAVLAIAGLTGHERLDLAARLAEAAAPRRDAGPTGRPPTPRRPRRDAGLQRLQDALRDDLAALDRRLAADRHRPSDDLLAALGAWTAFATDWRRAGAQRDVPCDCDPSACNRYGRTAALRAAWNLAAAVDYALPRVRLTRPYREDPTDLGFIGEIHALVLRGRPPGERFETVWQALPVRRPRQARQGLGTPAARLPAALKHWSERFHRDRAGALHPLIRSGLAHLAFAHHRPFVDGNGRTGRIILQAMHAEAGLPALPLLAVFEQDRRAYLQALGRAIEAGTPEVYLRWHLDACRKAIDLAVAHGPACAALAAALEAAIRSPRLGAARARRLAAALVCAPVANMEHLIRLSGASYEQVRRACHRLERAGRMSVTDLDDEPLLFIVPEALDLVTKQARG